MPVEERGQGGLDPAPYGKMRLLRRSACEFLRGRKKTPACQPADGRNNSVVRFFPFDPGDGSGPGAAPCVSDLSCSRQASQ